MNEMEEASTHQPSTNLTRLFVPLAAILVFAYWLSFTPPGVLGKADAPAEGLEDAGLLRLGSGERLEVRAVAALITAAGVTDAHAFFARYAINIALEVGQKIQGRQAGNEY